MMQPDEIELYFHGVELAVIVLGMALPQWISTIQLRRILRDFPPHRHNGDGGVTFPKGYEPPKEHQLFRTQSAGK